MLSLLETLAPVRVTAAGKVTTTVKSFPLGVPTRHSMHGQAGRDIAVEVEADGPAVGVRNAGHAMEEIARRSGNVRRHDRGPRRNFSWRAAESRSVCKNPRRQDSACAHEG